MNNKICQIHNEPALFCEQDAKKNQVLLCRFCVQQRLKIQNIDDVNNEEKQELQQLEMYFDQNIKQLKDFAEILEQFTLQIQQKLKKLKNQVEQHQSHLMEKKKQLKNLSNDFSNLQLNIINDQKNQINSSLTQIILQLTNQIKELEVSTKLDQLYQMIQQINKLNQFDDIKKSMVIEKKFDYQLMQQSSYKLNEQCNAIAFNKDTSIMIASCKKLIIIFQFQNDKLKELQQLSGHSSDVQCLKFMNKSNQFVSGSIDSTIIIWELNQNKQWQSSQVLKGHSQSSWCLLLNYNENLLISGSPDNTIKFWQKQNNTWNCNQSIDCQGWVYSISLNDSDDQLVASVGPSQILLIQLKDKYWMIKQKISLGLYGQRLCYINSNQFLFQPYSEQHLQIFDYDAKDQTYQKGQVLKYKNKENDDDCLFPIQYLSQIGLIIVKNGNHVHLIKKNKNGKYTVDQSINFNTYRIYGCITEDGRYIATWDHLTREIQIRKFEF